jgi:hypothetical protein
MSDGSITVIDVAKQEVITQPRHAEESGIQPKLHRALAEQSVKEGFRSGRT